MSKCQHFLNFNSANTFIISLLAVSLLLGGCATTTTPKDGQTAEKNTDPYENFNRKMYTFNDKVDDYVAKPIADAYQFITPDFMQTGIKNFFSNLQDVNVVINDMLQGKLHQSAKDSGRLLMNTTLGMAGFFDVAKTVGLPKNEEDFDQTLAVWGVPQGSYIVLPFLGPITTRGIPGAVFDTAANPASYAGAPIQVIQLINTRANAEGSLKFIDEASLDPYVFTRESFLQWRNHLVTDGKSDSSTNIDDIDPESIDSPSTSKSDGATADEPSKAKTSAATPVSNPQKK